MPPIQDFTTHIVDNVEQVIIGKRDHVEVRGLTGDLVSFDVVLTEAEVFELKEHPCFGVAAQTTQPIDRVQYLVGLIRWRFPNSEVRFVDTVCRPTKQRQQAATELGVSPSTLKRWTKDFGPFLSPSSTVTGDGTGRRFSPEDVELLARIKEQLAGGLSTDEVVEQMNAEGRSETATLAMSRRCAAGR